MLCRTGENPSCSHHHESFPAARRDHPSVSFVRAALNEDGHMLVYGDAEDEELPAELRSSISEKIGACLRMPAGHARHEMLVRAFIRTGELAQGLADREFAQRGADDLSPSQEAGACLLKGLAVAIDRSWKNGFAGGLVLPDDWLEMLSRLETEGRIRTRRGEGYIFYALYPESYLAAARASGLGPDTVVIGLRSIGTGLAALVAAGLDAEAAFSLRPVGHPFDRSIAVTSALTRKILDDENARYAIVDEGPGLSGSSFGCVADWLEGHGVAEDRIHIFPSHKGDLGSQASDRHRQRWKRLPRHCMDVDGLILDGREPAHQLRKWISALVDKEIDSWKDISGGAWRDLDRPDRDRLPADMQNEKRKFLASAGDQSWLVKFAGLGEDGAWKARKAAVLSEAGITPKIVGMRYGFIAEQWIPGICLSEVSVDRSELIELIGRYLGFRARHLQPPRRGASLDDLCRMALVNAEELLGPAAARRIGGRIKDADRFASDLRPVDTDNRVHAWEWIVSPDGKVLKTDALDHSAAHDLVGCQDIAWDIAGAAVEFDLSPEEREQLRRGVAGAAGYETGNEVIALFELFYLCFQAGLWTYASASQTGEEAMRAIALVRRYADRLSSLLQ
jgi:hypothetical protein